jgi:argonaute-like protein
MIALEAIRLSPPRLSFDAAMPSRTHTEAYRGLSLHGPFDPSAVGLGEGSLLFVFPKRAVEPARTLARSLLYGLRGYPGFERMFRTPVAAKTAITALPIDVDSRSPEHAAASYRDAITSWAHSGPIPGPELALVLVPHSERWETDRPYYTAKAAFAKLGIPTQMVTTELLENESQFGWAIANIALQVFAKLGGVPWTVEAPPDERDLVIGVGRADVKTADGARRIFGYAVSFAANGVYRQTWSFTPAADQETYEQRLEDALVRAIADGAERDEPDGRLVVHLAKRTGRREIRAARRAMERTGTDLPAAFLRVDDTTLYDLADGGAETLAADKGLAVRLGARRMLLQAEALSNAGAPDGPILIELDERSDVEPDEFEGLVAETYRLAHANWRGFNARSQPVTLFYGEQLARLVGALEEVDNWDPEALRSELLRRPWFL